MLLTGELIASEGRARENQSVVSVVRILLHHLPLICTDCMRALTQSGVMGTPLSC